MHIFLHLCLVFALTISASGCALPSYSPRDTGSYTPPPEGFQASLRKHVKVLAGDIGPRNAFRPEQYAQAADYIEATLKQTGLEVRRQAVVIPDRNRFDCGPMTVYNIEAVLPGTEPDTTIVIGAHYDTKVASAHWKDSGTRTRLEKPGTPGADDNASGVAVMLEIAQQLAKTKPRYTIRFVAFANEEPPFFQTEAMGSTVYAKSLREQGTDVRAMIAMEMLGCYHRTAAHDQFHFVTLIRPLLGLPSLSYDYVVMMGNFRSTRLMHRCADVFQTRTKTTLRVLPMLQIPVIVAWSDDWSFWQQGYRAFSLTDSGLLRNHHYHEPTDTPDTLDYETMADVAWAATALVDGLANEQIETD